jgi:hypothetical protein
MTNSCLDSADRIIRADDITRKLEGKANRPYKSAGAQVYQLQKLTPGPCKTLKTANRVGSVFDTRV